jgi:hypothetical protein
MELWPSQFRVHVSASGSNPSIDSASELAKLLSSQGHCSRNATDLTTYTRENWTQRDVQAMASTSEMRIRR